MLANFVFVFEPEGIWILYWRKSGDAQNPRFFFFEVQYPQSLIIWGAASSSDVCSD